MLNSSFSEPRRLTLLVTTVALSCALLSACSRPTPAEEPLRAVKVLTVGANTMQSGLEFSGEIRPRIESRLGFRVAGKLIRRHVELGQRVKAGQVLAQLDPQDYQLAVDAAQAQLRSQRNQGAYATLVSDVAGVVTAVEADPGQVVSAGTPVVRVAQDGPRDAVFSVPEDKMAAVRQGSAVEVRIWPGQTVLFGKVREVSASADAVTRTYLIKVGLERKRDQPEPSLGATVTVVPQALGAQAAPVIKLPTSALRQEGQATAVWVLDKDSMTVKSQVVQIATADGNEAVVATGLQPGMAVVTAGVHVLSPGQKVMIYQDKSAKPIANTAQTSIHSGVTQSGTSGAAERK